MKSCQALCTERAHPELLVVTLLCSVEPRYKKKGRTAHHLQQECPSYELHRRQIWPSQDPVQDQLYGDVNSLRKTTAFFKNTNVDVWIVLEKEDISKMYSDIGETIIFVFYVVSNIFIIRLYIHDMFIILSISIFFHYLASPKILLFFFRFRPKRVLKCCVTVQLRLSGPTHLNSPISFFVFSSLDPPLLLWDWGTAKRYKERSWPVYFLALALSLAIKVFTLIGTVILKST
jgi:hypothetical protein